MNTLLASAPLAVIVGAGLLILLVDAFFKGRSGRFPAPIGAIALAASFSWTTSPLSSLFLSP